MRERLWNNLIDLRFKAYYFECYATFVSVVDTVISIFVALVTSASVGAWLHNKEHAAICAVVIFTSQAVSVARPFIPSLRKSQEYTKCSLALEKLYISMEAVWFKCENAKNDDGYGPALEDIRDKLHRIACLHVNLPTLELWFLTKRARRKIDGFMALNFSSHEQTNTASATTTSPTSAAAAFSGSTRPV
jgi:hypothetical protein